MKIVSYAAFEFIYNVNECYTRKNGERERAHCSADAL